jgi:hypothetical protein
MVQAAKKTLKLAKKYKKFWEKEYMKYCFQSSFYDYGLNGPVLADPYNDYGHFYNGSTILGNPSGSHTLASTFAY